jgi:hypothetical protein
MGGHATHDEAEARENLPKALFEYWGERDPLGTYEAWLLQSDIALEEGVGAYGAGVNGLPAARSERNRAILEHVAAQVGTEVEQAAEVALESRAKRMPDGSDVDHDTFAESAE